MAGLVLMAILLGADVNYSGSGKGQGGTDFPSPVRTAELIDLDPLIALVCDLSRLPLICPDPPEAPAAADPAAPAPGTTDAGAVMEEQAAGGGAVASSPANVASRGEAPSTNSPIQPSALSDEAETLATPAVPPPEGDQTVEGPSDSLPAPANPARSLPAPGNEPNGSLALAAPEEVDLSPSTVAVAVGTSLLGLILIGFPAELFNRTLRENYPRLRRLLPWLRSPASSRGMTWEIVALLSSCVVAGLIATVQNARTFGYRDAVTIAVAIACGFLVTTGVYEVVSRVAVKKMDMPPRHFRAYPGMLPVVALFVAISTLGNLQPAYVYGHLAGSPSRKDGTASPRKTAIRIALASTALLAVSLLCWALRAVVEGSPETDILAGIAIVGLNRLAFGLAPVTFLAGSKVFSYSRPMWAAIYVPTLCAFLLLVLLPVIRSAPAGAVGASLAPFAMFAGLSIAIWAWFRRPAAPSDIDPAPAKTA